MHGLGKRILARPLGLLALCAIVGIILAEYLPAWSFWFLVGTDVVFAALAWRGKGIIYLLIVTLFIFATLHQTALLETRAHPLFIEIEKQNASCGCVVTGRVEKAFRRDMPGSKPGAAWFQATEISAPDIQRRFMGHTALKLSTSKTTALPPGEYRIEGTLHLAPTPDNPGQFDQRDHDARLGLATELRARQVTLLRKDRLNIPAFMQETAENCREWIKQQLSLEMEDSTSESTLIQAIVLGASEAATDEMEKPFRQTGTMHLFAVSGLHVAIVGFIFLLFLRPFGARRSVMLAILVPALFGYAFVTGLRPATMRAAVMAAVFFSAPLFHRRSDSLNSLGAAALLILGFDTQQLFSAGFQLSFGVIAAIAILNPLIRKPFMRFVDADPFIPKTLLTVWQHHWIAAKAFLLGLFTVSAAATCGSVPFMMEHFHIITPSSLLANMALVPMAFLVLFTAIVTLLSAVLHLHLFQSLFINANWFFAKTTFLIAQLFSYAPASHYYLPALGLAPSAPIEFNVLRMPGGGAAQHLRVGDENWLLDVGAAKDFRYILRAYLQHRGVNSISGLVLSQSGSQHIGGTTPMLHEYPVNSINQSVLEPWRAGQNRRKMSLIYSDGLEARQLAADDSLIFGNAGSMSASGTVLYPPRTALPKRANDRALVMRLDLGPYRILWCNDAGFLAEKTILDAFTGMDLHCDIIVRNQHADDFSMLPEFLDAVHPRFIITSNNSFPPDQKLTPQLREDCAARKITLLDQAQTGAIILKAWPQRMEIAPFKQPGQTIIITPRSAEL